MSKAQKDILPPNKSNLQLGAAQYISSKISERRTEVKINGKPHKVRRYIATVTNDPRGTNPEARTLDATAPALDASDKEPATTLLEYNDPAAKDRIIAYLMTRVMGQISERFALLAAQKVDVKQVAEALKAEIDAIAQRYSAS